MKILIIATFLFLISSCAAWDIQKKLDDEWTQRQPTWNQVLALADFQSKRLCVGETYTMSKVIVYITVYLRTTCASGAQYIWEIKELGRVDGVEHYSVPRLVVRR